MTGDELKQKRLALNLTQAELAAELGVTVTAIAMWERGERKPATPKMLSLAMRQIEMEHTAPDDLLRRARELAERMEAKAPSTRQRVRKSEAEGESSGISEAEMKRIRAELQRRWRNQ